MKKLFNLTAALLALAFTAASCVSEKTEFTPNETPSGDAVGYLSFEGTGLNVITDEEVIAASQPRPTAAPDVNAFQVDILNSENTAVLSFKYGEKPTDPVELPVGNYTLSTYSATVPEAEWEAPVYAAKQEFSITKGATTSLGSIACKLANIKVTVGYSADLAVDLEEGTRTTVTVAPNSLVFAKDEARAGYLLAPADLNPMQVEINLVIAGQAKKMTTTIPDTKAGQWRKITVNKEYSNEGKVSFTITIETLTLDEEIVIDVTTQLVEEVINEKDPDAPSVVWADHDIDQQFQLLKAMFDENGNYIDAFDIQVSSEKSTIAKFQIDITSSSNEFMASLTQMNITPSFDLCQVDATSNPTLNTALKMIGFRTGSEVLGQTSVAFDLKAVMGLLYGFDGTHDFRMTVTDADGRTTEKTLSLLVDKAGESGNPSSAPTIEWLDYDIDQTYEVSTDLIVKIDVKAESGIAGFIVDIDSDVLTSDILGGMGLGKHIDLIEPGDMETMLSTPYPEGLGFPVKDQVRNQTDVIFDISNFMQMILDLGMPGYFNFQLTITDNQNNVTTKTVKLIVSNI